MTGKRFGDFDDCLKAWSAPAGMSRGEAIYELKKSLWWVMEKILEGWVTEDGSKCEIDWDGNDIENEDDNVNMNDNYEENDNNSNEEEEGNICECDLGAEVEKTKEEEGVDRLDEWERGEMVGTEYDEEFSTEAAGELRNEDTQHAAGDANGYQGDDRDRDDEEEPQDSNDGWWEGGCRYYYLSTRARNYWWERGCCYF